MYIEEVAKMKNLTESTLRYYEKENIIPKVPRNKNGHRCYNEEILEWVDFVVALKETGMTLQQIKTYTSLYDLGFQTLKERKGMMIEHQKNVKKSINKTIEHLEKINYKIALYDIQLKKIKRMP